jgi:hypothetical protein
MRHVLVRNFSALAAKGTKEMSYASQSAKYDDKSKGRNDSRGQSIISSSKTTATAFRVLEETVEHHIPSNSPIHKLDARPIPVPPFQTQPSQQQQKPSIPKEMQLIYSRLVTAGSGPAEDAGKVDQVGNLQKPGRNGRSDISILGLASKLNEQVVSPLELKERHKAREAYWRTGLLKQKQKHLQVLDTLRSKVFKRSDEITLAYY